MSLSSSVVAWPGFHGCTPGVAGHTGSRRFPKDPHEAQSVAGGGELAEWDVRSTQGPDGLPLRLWPEPALVSWELGPGWMWARPPCRGRQLGIREPRELSPACPGSGLGWGTWGGVREASLSTGLGELSCWWCCRLEALRPGIGPWLSPLGWAGDWALAHPEGLSGMGAEGAGQPVMGLVRDMSCRPQREMVYCLGGLSSTAVPASVWWPGRMQRGDACVILKALPVLVVKLTHISAHGQHSMAIPLEFLSSMCLWLRPCAGWVSAEWRLESGAAPLPEITFPNSHLPLLQGRCAVPMGPSAASGPLHPPPPCLGLSLLALRVSGQKLPVGWPTGPVLMTHSAFPFIPSAQPQLREPHLSGWEGVQES